MILAASDLHLLLISVHLEHWFWFVVYGTSTLQTPEWMGIDMFARRYLPICCIEIIVSYEKDRFFSFSISISVLV